MTSFSKFHYVCTPTGTISGKSVLQQTEDAINEIADFAASGNQSADEALRIAKLAEQNSTLALNSANEAITTANSALEKVDTLSTVVNSWDKRIQSAEANSANAATVANGANSKSDLAIKTSNQANETSKDAVTKAEQAVSTSEASNLKSEQAVGTANGANQTANEAKEIAQKAQIDSEQTLGEMNKLLEVATQKANEANISAQDAAGSANTSAINAELAKKWAIETETPLGTLPDPTGGENEINLYGAKYYAEQAATYASEVATHASEAATSAQASADSAKIAEQKATEASESAQTASASAKVATDAQKASETARDDAEQFAIRAEDAAEGDVKTVNGVKPDENGNVNVTEYEHPNSGVSAGTYNSVTVNAQGHVTAGSNTTFAAVATSGNYNDLANRPALHSVAFTGDYNALINRPGIPPTVGGGGLSWVGTTSGFTMPFDGIVNGSARIGSSGSVKVHVAGNFKLERYAADHIHGTEKAPICFFAAAGQSVSVEGRALDDVILTKITW